MYGLEPGLYVVADFRYGLMELRATWRNEDDLLSPTAAATWLTELEVCPRYFLSLRRNLFCERDRTEL